MSNKYQHQEQHWSKYRHFEDHNTKDSNLKRGGFTTGDRITSFNDLSYEPSPPPQPKPKAPPKLNPNQLHHPKYVKSNDQQNDMFVNQYTDALLKRGVDPNNDSDLNKSDLSNKFETRIPVQYQEKHSIQSSVPDIDIISFKNKIIGIICIICAISSWVSMGQILKHIQSNYDKAYFMSYSITSGLSILIFLWLIIYYYDKNQSRQLFTQDAFKTISNKQHEYLFKRSPLWKRLLLPSFIFAVLFVACQYFWVLSLQKTMVSVNTTIYQSNVAVIYILSIFVLNNHLSWQKNIGVILCIIGVLTVLYGAYKHEDEEENKHIPNEVEGIIECIVSVLCYSIYNILFKLTGNKHFDQTHLIRDTLLLASMTGIMSLISLWFVIFIVDSVADESFELPSSNKDITHLILSVILNVLFAASFSIGMILTNPVIMSVGCLFVLPVGYFSDIILHDYEVEISAILGTVAITFGFLLLVVPLFSFIKKKFKKKENI